MQGFLLVDILVDILSLLLGVVVHPANVQEREGAFLLLAAVHAQPHCSRLELMWADSGFRGEPFERWVALQCCSAAGASRSSSARRLEGLGTADA